MPKGESPKSDHALMAAPPPPYRRDHTTHLTLSDRIYGTVFTTNILYSLLLLLLQVPRRSRYNNISLLLLARKLSSDEKKYILKVRYNICVVYNAAWHCSRVTEFYLFAGHVLYRLITCSPWCEAGPIESDEMATKNNDFSHRLTQQYIIIIIGSMI